ncbi:MAG: aminotransferase class V-fold PLP-dependent enzyme, partial [Cytophagales bacterium]|nr:aminotransferase class V-fold PLP-dependent enzyme [Cytophagales bacterium]
YGPTGVGVLYGKRALLESIPPYQGGGEMIDKVTMEQTTYNEIPYKFEAGTPNIADIIAFKEALSFIAQLGKESMARHEAELLTYTHKKLSRLDKVRFIGTAQNKIGVISFIIEGMHHLDVGMLLDANGIVVRTGHHCTQPLIARFGIEGTVRASFAVYNTKEEVDRLVEVVERIMRKKK